MRNLRRPAIRFPGDLGVFFPGRRGDRQTQSVRLVGLQHLILTAFPQRIHRGRFNTLKRIVTSLRLWAIGRVQMQTTARYTHLARNTLKGTAACIGNSIDRALVAMVEPGGAVLVYLWLVLIGA